MQCEALLKIINDSASLSLVKLVAGEATGALRDGIVPDSRGKWTNLFTPSLVLLGAIWQESSFVTYDCDWHKENLSKILSNMFALPCFGLYKQIIPDRKISRLLVVLLALSHFCIS